MTLALGRGGGLPFVYLYCMIDTTLFLVVCICIDFRVYDNFPDQDLFIFFSMLN